MKTGTMNPASKGFTLIELLVVVGVLIVLVALLTPAISSIQKQAAVSQAQSDVASLTAGLNRYLNDYGHYPLRYSGTPSTFQLQQIYQILSGVNISGLNPRNIVYIHPNPKQLKVVSNAQKAYPPFAVGSFQADSSGTYTNWVDPWDGSYMVLFNMNVPGNDTISVPSNDIGAPFAIYSFGPDMKSRWGLPITYCDDFDNKDNIKSW